MARNSSYRSRGGSPVEKQTSHSLFVEVLISSGWMFLYSIIFAIFGIVFIIDAIPGWVKLIVGILFSFPVILLEFSRGRTIGERDYKLKNNSALADVHKQSMVKVNPFVSLLHGLPFFVLSVLLILIAELAKQQWLNGIMLFLFIPTTLVFMGAGVLNLGIDVWVAPDWMAFGSVVLMAALVMLAFVVGYFISVIALTRRDRELINELRSAE